MQEYERLERWFGTPRFAPFFEADILHAEADRQDVRVGGRAWLNGREVGGTDPRYTHLEASHD